MRKKNKLSNILSNISTGYYIQELECSGAEMTVSDNAQSRRLSNQCQ